jgi:hypothetical protein
MPQLPKSMVQEENRRGESSLEISCNDMITVRHSVPPRFDSRGFLLAKAADYE